MHSRLSPLGRATTCAVALAALAALAGCGPDTGSAAAPATPIVRASTFGPFTAPTAAGVTVVAKGFTNRKAHRRIVTSFGVVLFNNGSATSVYVTTQGLSSGAVVDTVDEIIAVVPPHSFFVVGGDLTEMKTMHDSIRVVVTDALMGHMATDALLSVKVTVPSAPEEYENLPLSITNESSITVPAESAAYVVLLDARGRIVGGGNGYTNVPIPAHTTTRYVLKSVGIPRGAKEALGYVDLFNAAR